MQVACPADKATAEHSGVDPSLKVTDPVGVDVPETVAMNVTNCPGTAGLD
jgi:hypothetical protein